MRPCRCPPSTPAYNVRCLMGSVVTSRRGRGAWVRERASGYEVQRMAREKPAEKGNRVTTVEPRRRIRLGRRIRSAGHGARQREDLHHGRLEAGRLAGADPERPVHRRWQQRRTARQCQGRRPQGPHRSPESEMHSRRCATMPASASSSAGRSSMTHVCSETGAHSSCFYFVVCG